MAGVANLPSTGWTPEEPCPLEWRFQEEGRFLVWQTEPYFSLHAEHLHLVRCQVDCPSHSNDTNDGSETNAFSASVHAALRDDSARNEPPDIQRIMYWEVRHSREPTIHELGLIPDHKSGENIKIREDGISRACVGRS